MEHKRDGGTHGGQTPRVQQGPGCSMRAAMGGGTAWDMTADAYRRRGEQSERRRMSGGGFGIHPGGRRSGPGKEVGIGCNW